MSHIHLPDGVLPAWLWLTGYALTTLLVAILWRHGRATAEPRRFALLGVFSAVMILIMSIEIPPFGFHFNLSVVTGIILGPQLAILAALIVNLLLSLLGHGGITVVGINTLVSAAEMTIGYYTFKQLRRLHLSTGRSGFTSTVGGLLCGTALSYGIIAAAKPWIDRALQTSVLHAGERFAGGHINLARLAVIMFGLGVIGWVLEGLLSAAILNSLAKIRPDLLAGDEKE